MRPIQYSGTRSRTPPPTPTAHPCYSGYLFKETDLLKNTVAKLFKQIIKSNITMPAFLVYVTDGQKLI